MSPVANRSIEVSEFGLKDITCEIPKTRIAVGQLVSVHGLLFIGNREHPFEATGKIESSEAVADGGARVRIALRRFETALWEEFQEGLRARQRRISHLLASMKGDDQ